MNVLQMLTKEWCIHGTLLVLVETPRKTIRPKIVNMIECTPFSSKCLSFFSSLHQHQNSGTQINKTKTTLERCVKMEEKRKSTWGSFSMCQHTNYEHSHPTTKRNGKSHSTHTHSAQTKYNKLKCIFPNVTFMEPKKKNLLPPLLWVALASALYCFVSGLS